jgi:hypothetical protein
MANYNKSFNFRNGVQVDEDDLIVRSSLVGIGTTIPRAELDVYGTLRSTGIITAKDVYVTGIATFSNIQIGAGITIDGNAGIITATFVGDGSGLFNIPTSQWVDVDPTIYPGVGVGYSSIWAGGTVGIGTTIPRSWLQIGGDPGLGQNGVGISSIGDINASGIVTAGFLVGSGANITNINAANITSGILDSARLPSSFSFSGIITAQTFSGQVNSGVGTVTTLSGTNLNYTNGTIGTLNSTNGTITNLTGTIGTVATLNSTNATITNLVTTNISGITTINSNNAVVTSLTSTNLGGTIGTITTLNSTNATITTLSGTTGTISNLSGTNISYSGIGTIGVLTATNAYVGTGTATTFKSGDIRLGFTASNQVDTETGNLILDSNGGLIDINDNLDVSGTTTLQDEVTVNTGIVPDISNVAYIGKLGQEFLELWVGDIKVGVGNSNIIETINEDLILDPITNQVVVDANLRVVGITTLTDALNLGSSIEPTTDLGTTLGSASKRFSSSQIGALRVGVAQTFEIDTTNGTDLVLNSSSGTTRINDDLYVTGIGSFAGELTVEIGIVPDESLGAYIGTSGKPFSGAYIDNLTIGVSNSNEIDTTTGNLRLNADSGQTEVVTNLSVSGVSTFSQETHLIGLSNFSSGIVPDNDKGAYIGSQTNAFSEAYINEVRIGVGGTNVIDTREGNLILNSNTNIVKIESELVVDEDVTLRGDTFFGDDRFVVVDNLSKSIGIGTSSPNERFQVMNETGDLRTEFISHFTQSEIGIGLSEVGAGTSVGVVGYAISTFNIINEDVGGMNFVIHDGSAGVGTTGFAWIYGQDDSNLMKLDYNGKLTLGNLFGNTVSTLSEYPATVAISSATGIGNTALYVDGDIILEGKTEITGIVSFKDPTGNGQNAVSYNPANGDFTVRNLIVKGSTTGVSAVGSGVTVFDDTFSFGTASIINFARGIDVQQDGLIPGQVNVSTGSTQYALTQIGIGTTAPRSVLDVERSGGLSVTTGTEVAPFVILPRITTTERNSFTGIVGSIIYNTTNTRFEVFMPGGWCGVATVT